MLQNLFGSKSKRYEATTPFTDLSALPHDNDEQDENFSYANVRVKAPKPGRVLQPISTNISNGDKLKQAYDMKMTKSGSESKESKIKVAKLISPSSNRDFLKIKSPLSEQKLNRIAPSSSDLQLKTPRGSDITVSGLLNASSTQEPYVYQFEKHKFAKAINTPASKKKNKVKETPVPVEPQLYVYDDDNYPYEANPQDYSEIIPQEEWEHPLTPADNQWYQEHYPDHTMHSPYPDKTEQTSYQYADESKYNDDYYDSKYAEIEPEYDTATTNPYPNNNEYLHDNPYEEYEEKANDTSDIVNDEDNINVMIDTVFSKVRHNRISEVKQSLADGFHAHSVDANGNTMLHICAQNNLKKLALVVITAGCPINEVNIKGFTALDYLNQYKFYDMSRWLVDKYQAEAFKASNEAYHSES